MSAKIFLPIVIILSMSGAVPDLSAQSSSSLTVDTGSESSFVTVQASPRGGASTPLWDPDPLSSAWGLVLNGRHVVPSEAGWVRENRVVGDVRRIIYSDQTASLVQEAVVSGEGSHVRITATLTNNGTEAIDASLYLVLDTFLGETTGLPFLLDDGTYVRSESVFSGSDVPAWVKTVRNNSSPKLTILLDGRIPTRPDRVVMANWLRMKQGGASFVPAAGRSFDYLPFSEADSALLIDYDTQTLRPGDSREIVVVAGLDENVPSPDTFESAVRSAVDSTQENIRLREYTIRQRLRELSTLIDAIDTAAKDESMLTDELISEMEGKASSQEKLRAEYENL